MPSAWFRLPVHDAAPPSLHGVREGPFPRFGATMGRCDSLTSVSPHFVAFAGRYHRCVPRSSPTAQDTGPRIILELVSRVSGRPRDGDGRASQVPGGPS
jgi:hypothetical protein